MSTGAVIRSPNDLVARYCGEEFAVILPDADGAAALAVAERMWHGVERDHSAAFKITISIGCLSVQPGSGRVAGSADMIE